MSPWFAMIGNEARNETEGRDETKGQKSTEAKGNAKAQKKKKRAGSSKMEEDFLANAATCGERMTLAEGEFVVLGKFKEAIAYHAEVVVAESLDQILRELFEKSASEQGCDPMDALLIEAIGQHMATKH